MSDPTEPTLVAKVLAIHDALARAALDHAIGGALALAYHGEPRATVDIDVNIFVPPTDAERVGAVLGPLGVDLDRLSTAERDGQVRLWWGRTPVDLFFAYDEVHATMAKHVEVVPFADRELPILSAADLVFCKAVFDRPKDWIDIDQMLAVAGPRFDIERVRDMVDRIAGPDDRRRRHLDAVAMRHLGR